MASATAEKLKKNFGNRLDGRGADKFAVADEAMSAEPDSDEPQQPSIPLVPDVPIDRRQRAVRKNYSVTDETVYQIGEIDRVLLRNAIKAKDSEIVRAAIAMLAVQDESTILHAFSSIERLPTGGAARR